MKVTLTKEEKFHAKKLAYEIQADLINCDQSTILNTKILCSDVLAPAWNLTNEHTKRKQYNSLLYIDKVNNFKNIAE